jgi:hypothetical protein
MNQKINMTITDVLPSVVALSNADKFRLVQIVLKQLAQENGVVALQNQQKTAPFDSRHYFGTAHQTKQMIDDYLITEREGWN